MSKILKRCWTTSSILIAISAASPAIASCVSPGRIINGGTEEAIKDVYDSRHQCGTCPGQDAYPAFCDKVNKLLLVDHTGVSDLIPIPHRGVWGPVRSGERGASENTQAALNEAKNQGYDYIEIDAAMSHDYQVYLGHYFSMKSVSEISGKTPSDYTLSEITQYKMRKRDQGLSGDLDDRIASMFTVIEWARNNNVILFVDPKIPADPIMPEQYKYIIAKTLMYARQAGALKNIVIKTTDNHTDTESYLVDYFGKDNYEDLINGRFLWSPIANKDEGATVGSAIAYLDDWMPVRKQIATVEAGLYSPDHWASLCIARNESGVTTYYENLIGYVDQKMGRRSALWSVESMGDKGTFGRTYNWKFIGNTPTDRRGNPIQTLSYSGAMRAVINTDRPDWFKSMVSKDWPVGQVHAPQYC